MLVYRILKPGMNASAPHAAQHHSPTTCTISSFGLSPDGHVDGLGSLILALYVAQSFAAEPRIYQLRLNIEQHNGRGLPLWLNPENLILYNR